MPSTFVLPPSDRAEQSNALEPNSRFKIGVLDVASSSADPKAARVQEMIRDHAALFQAAVVSTPNGQGSGWYVPFINKDDLVVKMVDRNDQTTTMTQAQLMAQVRPGRGQGVLGATQRGRTGQWEPPSSASGAGHIDACLMSLCRSDVADTDRDAAVRMAKRRRRHHRLRHVQRGRRGHHLALRASDGPE